MMASIQPRPSGTGAGGAAGPALTPLHCNAAAKAPAFVASE